MKQNVNQYGKRKEDKEVFVVDSNYSRRLVKKRIIEQSLIVYKCDCCGIGPVWNNKPMPLILDHINGVNNDNRLMNLRFVCSNCDTQLPTYKSKNRNKVEDRGAGHQTDLKSVPPKG
jgi:hypothetical protein